MDSYFLIPADRVYNPLKNPKNPQIPQRFSLMIIFTIKSIKT